MNRCESFGRTILKIFIAGVYCALVWLDSSARAENLAVGKDDGGPSAFKRLSLEELMDQEVTSVSRKPEKWSEASSAIYVLSQEDIHRSGVTSIADALRLVPGMEVARIDSATWAVSARGFNNSTANKLQVLIDGRSVYTPLYAGVFWDVQDTFLDDIDRIEVIRGPGATIWGANAVNGVVNVITRSAKDSQGVLLYGGGGSEERGFGGVRYGGKIGENAWYRVYAKYLNRDDSALPTGDPAKDGWEMAQGGFRADWEPNIQNSLTFQGDIYSGDKSQTSTPLLPIGTTLVNQDTTMDGGNLLGRWTHSFTSESELKLQVYYDRTHRHIPSIFEENRDTGNVDLQHEFHAGERNDFLWGLGYLVTSDQVDNSYSVSWYPDHRATQVYSAFLQDEITLIEDRLKLTLGSKFEHNDYTGFEAQPNVRLALYPTKRQTLWGAVSRAVRTPTRIDQDFQVRGPLPGPPGSNVLLEGNPDFRSEDLIAYELGYRVQLHERVSLDLATFYNDYNHLRSVEYGPFVPGAGGGINTQTAVLANTLEGETYGAELSANYNISDWWRMKGGYTFLKVQLHKKAGSHDLTSELAEGNDPENQFFLRSSMDLPQNIQFDATLRYVDVLSAMQIRSYLTADFRVAWQPIKQLEVALVVENLFDNQHAEFTSPLHTEVERSIYGKLTWRF
jgi:iron complex outermembrane receptor protein